MTPPDTFFAEDEELVLNGSWPSSNGGQNSALSGQKQRLPQFIVIGVRKCGTRALIEFLNIHSAITKARDEVS